MNKNLHLYQCPGDPLRFNSDAKLKDGITQGVPVLGLDKLELPGGGVTVQFPEEQRRLVASDWKQLGWNCCWEIGWDMLRLFFFWMKLFSSNWWPPFLLNDSSMDAATYNNKGRDESRTGCWWHFSRSSFGWSPFSGNHQHMATYNFMTQSHLIDVHIQTIYCTLISFSFIGYFWRYVPLLSLVLKHQFWVKKGRFSDPIVHQAHSEKVQVPKDAWKRWIFTKDGMISSALATKKQTIWVVFFVAIPTISGDLSHRSWPRMLKLRQPQSTQSV